LGSKSDRSHPTQVHVLGLITHRRQEAYFIGRVRRGYEARTPYSIGVLHVKLEGTGRLAAGHASPSHRVLSRSAVCSCCCRCVTLLTLCNHGFTRPVRQHVTKRPTSVAEQSNNDFEECVLRRFTLLYWTQAVRKDFDKPMADQETESVERPKSSVSSYFPGLWHMHATPGSDT
jgi:hypothetical protein